MALIALGEICKRQNLQVYPVRVYQCNVCKLWHLTSKAEYKTAQEKEFEKTSRQLVDEITRLENAVSTEKQNVEKLRSHIHMLQGHKAKREERSIKHSKLTVNNKEIEQLKIELQKANIKADMIKNEYYRLLKSIRKIVMV